MKLNKEQIAQFVSYISVTDIKNYIEQHPIEYEYFLHNEYIMGNIPTEVQIIEKLNYDFYILE